MKTPNFLRVPRVGSRTSFGNSGHAHSSSQANMEELSIDDSAEVVQMDPETHAANSAALSTERQLALSRAIKELKKHDSVQALKLVLHHMNELDRVITQTHYDALTALLSSHRNILRMVSILVDPHDDSSDSIRILDYSLDARGHYEYRYVICLYISYGPAIIRDKIVSEERLLRPLARYLSSKSPRSCVVLEYVARTVSSLLHHRAEGVLLYLLSNRNFMRNLVPHIGSSAIAALIPRMVCERAFFDTDDLRFGMVHLNALHMLARDCVQALIADTICQSVSRNLRVIASDLVLDNGLHAMRSLSVRAMMGLSSIFLSDETATCVEKSHQVFLEHAKRISTFDAFVKEMQNDPVLRILEASMSRLSLLSEPAPLMKVLDAALTDSGFWALGRVLSMISKLLDAYANGYFSRNHAMYQAIKRTSTASFQREMCKRITPLLALIDERHRDCAREKGHESRVNRSLELLIMETFGRLLCIANEQARGILAGAGVPFRLLQYVRDSQPFDTATSSILHLIHLSFQIDPSNAAFCWFVSADAYRFLRSANDARIAAPTADEKGGVSSSKQLGDRLFSALCDMLHNGIEELLRFPDLLRQMKENYGVNYGEIREYFSQFLTDESSVRHVGRMRQSTRLKSFGETLVFDEDEGEALWIYNMLLQREADDLSDMAINNKRGK
ncbi:Serine/threonine-protein phosphatase 6 regulatory subunit 2 [Porphyridium purpureum]|uniref:Serine/threonine-protein phosphatase 6 regulatory subunit 2 n=1 Tax=Porphyridium purpureum TaxID=35688 RepID=A0A5J4Z5H9_PORPP|nr:Serine/threonine-protein phosphatase 6 regulatory subunit 2 [Porphyridium purpureum]|eukprot:POR4942..scf295_1